MPKRVNGHKSEEIEDYIENYLNLHEEGCTFGEIKKHLEKIGIRFSNSDTDRTGLANTLKRMQKNGKVKKKAKDSKHIYPRYVSIKKTMFDTAMDGYLFNSEISNMLRGSEYRHELNDDFMKILARGRSLNDDEKFIMRYIQKFGFMMLYMIMSSYTRPINPKQSLKKNKEMRKVWLDNALFFNHKKEPEPTLFDFSLKAHVQHDTKNETLDQTIMKHEFFEDQYMYEKFQKMFDTMKELFPKTFENTKDPEHAIADSKDVIKSNWLKLPNERLPLRNF